MDSSWNIGMQGGFGSDSGVRAGGFFIGRRRWPEVRPEQIKPTPPPDAQAPRKPERPPPEVSP